MREEVGKSLSAQGRKGIAVPLAEFRTMTVADPDGISLFYSKVKLSGPRLVALSTLVKLTD